MNIIIPLVYYFTIGSIQTLNTMPCDLRPVVIDEQSYALKVDPISIPVTSAVKSVREVVK